MGKHATAQDRHARLRALGRKYSDAGRLQRFCRGRVALLATRLVFEAVGATAIALLIAPEVALVALTLALSGEVCEQVVARGALRRADFHAGGRILPALVATASGIWAAGMAGVVAVVWLAGPQYWVLALSLAFAAAANANLVGALHPPSLRIKHAVLLGVLTGLLLHAWITGTAPWRWIAVHAAGVALVVLTLAMLFYRLTLQNAKRHAAEHDLTAANIAQEEMNEALAESRDELANRASQAQAANAGKSEFLATMSHELRTPMNAVLSMAEMLGRSGLPAEQAEMASTIEEAGTSLLKLINDILDFSRIEAGRVALDSAPFDPAALLDEVTRLIRPLALEKALDFTCHRPARMPPWLGGDAARLRQVLINLVGNAVKFTEAGSVTLTLDAEARDDGWHLCFDVADSGCGIAPEHRRRIFDAFEQADGRRTRRHGGTGLGLAISHRLAQAMGGSLQLAGSGPDGSRFRLSITLPEAAAQQGTERGESARLNSCPTPEPPGAHPRAPAPEPARDPGPEPVPDLAGMRVLAAEDNRTNRLILSRMLRGTGAGLTMASNGEEAVALYIEERPDLVLMDMAMPRLSGPDAARTIRAQEAQHGWPACPILALTANTADDDRLECRAAGMNGFLTKPVRQVALLEAVQASLTPPEAPACADAKTTEVGGAPSAPPHGADHPPAVTS